MRTRTLRKWPSGAWDRTRMNRTHRAGKRVAKKVRRRARRRSATSSIDAGVTLYRDLAQDDYLDSDVTSGTPTDYLCSGCLDELPEVPEKGWLCSSCRCELESLGLSRDAPAA